MPVLDPPIPDPGGGFARFARLAGLTFAPRLGGCLRDASICRATYAELT